MKIFNINIFLEKIIYLIIGAIIALTIKGIYIFLKEKIIYLNPNRRKIKSIIEKTINDELNTTLVQSFELPILNKKVEVKWCKEKDAYSYLSSEGDVIIVLSTKTNVNFINGFCNALMLYLDESFMPQSEYYMGEDLYNICKLFVGMDVVKRKGADFIAYFREKYLNPIISNIKESEKIISKIDLLTKKRLFKTLFLREVYLLSTSPDVNPSETVRKEVNRFFNFLFNIANKEEYIKSSGGNEPPLDFDGRCIRIGLVLVKRIEIEEFTPHLKRIEKYINYGFNRIYVAGWSDKNIEGLRYIENKFKKREDIECDISKYKLSNTISFNVEFEDGSVEGLMLVISKEQ